jgi:hypothetical protein
MDGAHWSDRIDRRGKIAPLVGVVDAARTHAVTGHTGPWAWRPSTTAIVTARSPPTRRAARPSLFGVDQYLAPLGPPGHFLELCSGSAIRRSSASTGMALRPRSAVSAACSPRSRARRHITGATIIACPAATGPPRRPAPFHGRCAACAPPCTSPACALLPPARRPPSLAPPAGPWSHPVSAFTVMFWIATAWVTC